MDVTVARGRWAHAKTAKIYIDDGALALAEMLWTSRQKRLVKKLAKKFSPLCTQLRQWQAEFGEKLAAGCFQPVSNLGFWEVL